MTFNTKLKINLDVILYFFNSNFFHIGTWQDYEGLLMKPTVHSEEKCPLIVWPHGKYCGIWSYLH